MRYRLAYQADDNTAGTTTATGSTSTMTDSARMEMTGAWLGHFIYFSSGAAGVSGSEVRVTAFNPATGLLTFAPVLAGVPAAGTSYEIHWRSVARYNNALERAEAYGRQRTYVPMTVPFSFAAGAYGYTLSALVPMTLDTIHTVRMRHDDDWLKLTGPTGTSRPQWRIEAGDNPLLVFDPRYFTLPAAGGAFEVLGTRRPFLMASDSDTCELDEDWVLEDALTLLRESAATRGDGEDSFAHSDRALARSERAAALVVPVPPGSIPLRGA